MNSVHSGLAEQSFRHQVQSVMGDGIMNKERSEALAGEEEHQASNLSMRWAQLVI